MTPKAAPKARKALNWRGGGGHERQAERAAQGFGRGETGLGRGLSAAPAAQLFLPGSLGFPLPHALRGELERGFGADLGPIRVHTDAAAQVAARAAGAKAFAAGSRLYFADGHWSPFSDAGRRLIAHEVAHVLQQAGRPAAGGGRRVEAGVTGTAGVQRDPDNQAVIDARDQLVGGYTIEGRLAELGLMHPATGVAACLMVLDRYAALPADQSFLSLVEQLRAAVMGRAPEQAVDAVTAIMTGLSDSRFQGGVRALFRDCFKALGAHDEAVAATDDTTPEASGFGSWNFFADRLRGDGNWVKAYLATHPVGRRYWPHMVVAVARVDFFSPGRNFALNLDPNMQFDAVMTEAISAALLYAPLMEGERAVVALRALAVFDRVRQAPFSALQRATRGKNSLMERFEVKLRFLALYKDENFLASYLPSAEPEVMALLRDAGRRTAPIAIKAETFWQRALDFWLATNTQQEGADAAAQARAAGLQAAVQARLPGLRPLANLEAELMAAMQRTARLSRGGVPPATVLAANLAAGARAVEQIAYRVDGIVARNEQRQVSEDLPALADGEDAAEAALSDDMIYGIVQVFLYRLHHYLLTDYTPPGVAADAAESARQRDQLLVGYKTALVRFRQVGEALGFAELLAAERTLFHGDQAGLRRSQIALLAPFQEDDVPLEQLGREFPTDTIEGLPISGLAFVQMAYALYYEGLFDALGAALAADVGGTAREHVYEAGQEPIVNTAIDAVQARFEPPQRYKVPAEATILFVRPEDRNNMAVAALIDAGTSTERYHPEVQALRDGLTSDQLMITPKDYDRHTNGFVIWVVGNIAILTDTLAAVPGVTTLTKADGNALGWPSEYENPKLWLLELGTLVEAGDFAQDALDEAVQDRMQAGLTALEGPLRRATNNERRTVGPMIAAQWERMPDRFLDDPEAFYRAPAQAMQMTLQFLGNVQPSTDAEQKLQMAALLWELAPVLRRKLGSTTHFGDLIEIRGTSRFDIMMPLHPYMANAVQEAARATDMAVLQTRLALGFGGGDLQRRAGLLATLMREFEAIAQEHQAETVMEGVHSANMLRVPGRAYPLRGEREEAGEDGPERVSGDGFVLNGKTYMLIEVFRSFEYQPELAGQSGLIPVEGAHLGVRKLTVDGQPVSPGNAPVPLFRMARTSATSSQAEDLVVTSADTQLLNEITYGLHIHITMEGLRDLAVVLNESASMITLALQLAFPEFAAPMAAAEIAGSILQFWGSGEFATIKGLLNGDVGPYFAEMLGKVREDLDPEKLWGYLLFGEESDTIRALRTGLELSSRLRRPRGRGTDDRTKRGSISRVMEGITSAGTKVMGGVDRVHTQAGFAMTRLELAVQGSPIAALMMRAIARNLYRLNDLSLAEAGIGQAADAVQGAQDTLRRFETLLEALNAFELPEELVPLEAIVEMTVNFVIDHLPLKYRALLQALRTGVNSHAELRAYYEKLFELVADKLQEINVDPNYIWREYAKRELDPYVTHAAQEMATTAQNVLNQVPFLSALQTMDVPAVATSFLQGEAQPKLEGGLPLAPPRLPGGRGRALPHADHATAARGFGHDFSHVRLHRGAAVDAGLRRSGAEAATAGSHVWLDSRINTATPGGRATLHHELAHVLQQTGPRPLGRTHRAQPATPERPGASGARWRIDRGAEAQADQLASAAAQPAAGPRAVSRAGGAMDVQPSLTDVVARLFTKLGDPTALMENAEDLLRRPHTGAAADLRRAAPGLDRALPSQLTELLREAAANRGIVDFARPFDAARETIIRYILDNRRDELANFVRILPHALREVTVKERGNAGTGRTSKVYVLDAGRLETVIEEFFFGRTGVSVDVELRTEMSRGPDGRPHRTVSTTNPFSRFRVTYVHLPMIGGGAAIWEEIITASFPAAGARKPLYQAKARLALQGLQPGPGIFTRSRGRLKFGAPTIRLIEAYVNPPVGQTLPGDLAPRWADYIKTDPDAGDPTHGQIGLRLGFYRDKANPTQQKGTDRESHHTVQYLLIEYLVNTRANRKPFPHALSLYPNIRARGRSVEVIAPSPGANSGIRIADNDVGDRGPNMPTILLSAHAHSLGDVHVSPRPDDQGARGASQGFAVDGVFRGYLGGYAAVVADRAGLQALAARRRDPAAAVTVPQVNGADVTDASLSTAIYDASCKTYTWMRNMMNGKLERALDTQEINYYKALVATATNPAIYDRSAAANTDGEYSNDAAGLGYVPSTVGASIVAKVLREQRAAFEGPTFGFEEKP